MPAVYAPGEASEVSVCSGRRRERETVKQRRVGGGSVSNVVQRSNGGSTSAGGPRKPDRSCNGDEDGNGRVVGGERRERRRGVSCGSCGSLQTGPRTRRRGREEEGVS